MSRYLVSLFGALASSTIAAGLLGADPEIYRDRVKPFFEKYCVNCHGPKKPKGKITLHDLAGPAKFPEDVERWEKVLEMLESVEMPPEDEKQPGRADRAKIVGWIKAKLESTGHVAEWQQKLLYPEYGNSIDHDKLFDGSVKEAAHSPGRLWKRSPYVFESKVLRGIGLGRGRYGRPHGKLNKIKQPFAIEDKAGIKDFAAIRYADSATLGTLMRNAEVIVNRHVEGAMHDRHVQIHGPIPEEDLPRDRKGKPIRPRYHKTEPEFRAIILHPSSPTNQQIDAAVRKMYQLVIEREPTSEAVEKYRRLMRECMTGGDYGEGLRMALIAIAISPQAVYRMELGQGPKDEHGRQALDPADLAYSIAYALTDEPPDDALMEAAKTGRLKTREDVAREVARIWDDDAIDKPRVLRFFREYFGYYHAPKVFKDDARFGKPYGRIGVAQLLVDDADTLVRHIVKLDRDVLVELLTTEKYFVAHSGDNEKEKKAIESLREFYEYLEEKPWKEWPYQTPGEHAQHVRKIDRMFAHPNGNVVKGWMRYLTRCDENGVTPMPRLNKREYVAAYDLDTDTFSFPAEQPFVLAKGKRCGILMHPAWLIAHSLNLDNDPVRRGKWIRERLLAGSVPELPITVDARIPDAPEQSLRQRFEVTEQTECWRCHRKMNPLGMPFELYDDFGRYREVEKLHARGKTVAVNATGRLDNTGDPALDGDVENPIDMVHRLARSERVRQAFVRHAFRYWLGRNEMYSDSVTLIAADRAYVENGGSFRALVIELLTSDSFLLRKRIENNHHE